MNYPELLRKKELYQAELTDRRLDRYLGMIEQGQGMGQQPSMM